jgi:hypothetical protein
LTATKEREGCDATVGDIWLSGVEFVHNMKGDAMIDDKKERWATRRPKGDNWKRTQTKTQVG